MFILLFLLTCFLCVYEDNQSTKREQKRTCFFARRKPRNIGAFSFFLFSIKNIKIFLLMPIYVYILLLFNIVQTV